MPKIIKNIREQLLAEARRQIADRGYAETTIRSVAGACGVGIGTVYKYFTSTDMLIAAFMLEDWKKQLDTMARLPCDEPEPLLRGIYDSLLRFCTANEKLFSDEAAAKLISSGSAARHRLLRGQLAAFLLPLCQTHAPANAAFAAEFIAEALVAWSGERTPFDTLYPIIEKIINNR